MISQNLLGKLLDHNVLQIGSEYQWEWDSGKLGAYNYEAFGNWSHIGNTGTAASSDAWHHYASVRQGNNHRWYLDGVPYSSSNVTEINVADLGSSTELELIVKDSDGALDNISITLNQMDYSNENSQKLKNSNINFFNGLNLVLLTAFICVLILLFVKKKSTEENPLPKWSKYNKKL